jgi:hypothetical protein
MLLGSFYLSHAAAYVIPYYMPFYVIFTITCTGILTYLNDLKDMRVHISII